MISQYNNAEDYYYDYNKFKQQVIDSIKGNSLFHDFMTYNMNDYEIPQYKNGNFLWITGDNNWKELLENSISVEFQIYNGRVVELCFCEYEIYKDKEGNSFYQMGEVISANRGGLFKVRLMKSGEIVLINGDWLVDARTREQINMDIFTNLDNPIEYVPF